MKKIPFNLQDWLSDKSQKVVTRDGRPVEILKTNMPGELPLLVIYDGNDVERVSTDGKYQIDYDGMNDLFLVTEDELHDSEDERIRKALIDYVKKAHFLDEDSIIAYLEKQKEQEDDEDDFTIYHPLKNGEGKYECIPYSFYGSLTSFSDDKDLMDFLNESFYDKEECERWCERENISDLPECKHKIKKDSAFDYLCDNEKQKDIDAIKKDWFERGKKEVMTVPELYGLQKKEQKPSIFPPGFGEVHWNPIQCEQKEQSITTNDLDEEIKKFFHDCINVHEAKLYGNISERVIPVDCYELTARHFAKWGERKGISHDIGR